MSEYKALESIEITGDYAQGEFGDGDYVTIADEDLHDQLLLLSERYSMLSEEYKQKAAVVFTYGPEHVRRAYALFFEFCRRRAGLRYTLNPTGHENAYQRSVMAHGEAVLRAEMEGALSLLSDDDWRINETFRFVEDERPSHAGGAE